MKVLSASLDAEGSRFTVTERALLSGWIAMFAVAVLQNCAPWAAR